MSTEQPRTANYSDEARGRLGSAVHHARLAAGFKSRIGLATEAGISKRALDALELGEPTIGPRILADVGRTLGRYIDQWSEETPHTILEGGPPPPNRLRPAPEHRADTPLPDATWLQPVRYADLKDFLRAQITLLRRQGMSDELITATVRELLDEPDAKRR